MRSSTPVSVVRETLNGGRHYLRIKALDGAVVHFKILNTTRIIYMCINCWNNGHVGPLKSVGNVPGALGVFVNLYSPFMFYDTTVREGHDA